MIHHMKLWQAPFAAMRSGRKDVEMRLHDEKRQAIRPGDTIEFTNAETGETLTARVLRKQLFADFDALYAHYDKIRIGYTEDESPDPMDMQQFYSAEEMAAFGAVAIELSLIRK